MEFNNSRNYPSTVVKKYRLFRYCANITYHMIISIIGFGVLARTISSEENGHFRFPNIYYDRPDRGVQRKRQITVDTALSQNDKTTMIGHHHRSQMHCSFLMCFLSLHRVLLFDKQVGNSTLKLSFNV